MDYKDENLQNEQGSMQQQTQRNGQHNQAEEQKGEKEVGIIPASEVKGSDADQDRDGEPSLEDTDVETSEYQQDETQNLKTKRSYWNSITFDTDDFFGGLAPA